jgi:hypothetical protein
MVMQKKAKSKTIAAQPDVARVAAWIAAGALVIGALLGRGI